jgi:hypothetical protein
MGIFGRLFLVILKDIIGARIVVNQNMKRFVDYILKPFLITSFQKLDQNG